MRPALASKHALDRIGATTLILLLAPLLILIAVAVRLDSRGSAFFLQERIGAGNQPFTIFKFRTMRVGSEKDGLGVTTASDDQRITRVGRWLRATSLDELPQLFNIALGEMSFIGPRPTLRYQVEQYTPRQRQRLLFRPGITGWAQVHGRNEIPWERRIDLDLEYIDHYSLAFDGRILLRTLVVLLRRDGVYAPAGTNDDFQPVVPEKNATPVAPTPAPAPTTTVTAAFAPGPASVPGLLPLLVIGAGGHARVLIDIVEKQGRYAVVGLLDDRVEAVGTRVLGYPVLGGRAILERSDLPSHAIVAIGAPEARAAWHEHLESRGFQFAVLVHPSAQIGRTTTIDAGSVLMAGAIVNSGSQVGRGVIINTAASIDHDCIIGDFTHVAPGARLAGTVRVGARAHVGIGACVLQNRSIGDGAIVGGGAVVIDDVAAHSTVVGVPARPLPMRRTAPVLAAHA